MKLTQFKIDRLRLVVYYPRNGYTLFLFEIVYCLFTTSYSRSKSLFHMIIFSYSNINLSTFKYSKSVYLKRIQ